VDVSNAYSNLEKIITNGFLSVGVNYKNIHIVLKSITDREYQNIQYLQSKEDSYMDFLYKFSFCTMYINGINVMSDRERRVKEVNEFYSQLPVSFVSVLRKALQKLNAEYVESLNFLEGFCYTSKSRHIWKVLNLYDREIYVGLKGINEMGINSAQENWIVINKSLDDEDTYNREFANAILITSSMSPKGAKQVSKTYEQQRDELEEIRRQIAKYGYDKRRREEESKKDRWTAEVKTKEDLVRELYRQMEGKKDRHDLFMEHWLNKQKEKAEAAKREAEERQRRYRERLEQIDFTELEGSRPVSVEEMELVLQKSKAKKEKTSTYMSSTASSDHKDRFIKKVSQTVIRSPKDIKKR